MFFKNLSLLSIIYKIIDNKILEIICIYYILYIYIYYFRDEVLAVSGNLRSAISVLTSN